MTTVSPSHIEIAERRAQATTPTLPSRLSLDGEWELLPTPSFRGNYYSDEKWLTIQVPSHWQQHPDLEFYAGKVVYRKRFNLKKQKDRRYRLRLNGVFYFYIVYLNGFRLGENEGYFFPREFEITKQLKDQDVPNELLVEVDCPDEHNKSAKHLLTGVFSHWDCLDSKTNPGGIWQSVEIIESGPQYIREFRLTPLRRADVIRLADAPPPRQDRAARGHRRQFVCAVCARLSRHLHAVQLRRQAVQPGLARELCAR